MNLDQLALLGEFAGGVGVVLSLIYICFQSRQNTRSQRASSYGHTLDRMAAMQHTFAADAELSELFNRGLLAPEELSILERVRFVWVLTELFGVLEYMHQQYLEGHVPGDIWRRWHASLDWWMTFEGVRRWWHAKPTPFSDRFTALVESGLQADDVTNTHWEPYLLHGTGPSNGNVSPMCDYSLRSPSAMLTFRRKNSATTLRHQRRAS